MGGFISGFRLGFEGNRANHVARNLKSARLNPVMLKEKKKKIVSECVWAGLRDPMLIHQFLI